MAVGKLLCKTLLPGCRWDKYFALENASLPECSLKILEVVIKCSLGEAEAYLWQTPCNIVGLQYFDTIQRTQQLGFQALYYQI